MDINETLNFVKSIKNDIKDSSKVLPILSEIDSRIKKVNEVIDNLKKDIFLIKIQRFNNKNLLSEPSLLDEIANKSKMILKLDFVSKKRMNPNLGNGTHNVLNTSNIINIDNENNGKKNNNLKNSKLKKKIPSRYL